MDLDLRPLPPGPCAACLWAEGGPARAASRQEQRPEPGWLSRARQASLIFRSARLHLAPRGANGSQHRARVAAGGAGAQLQLVGVDAPEEDGARAS